MYRFVFSGLLLCLNAAGVWAQTCSYTLKIAVVEKHNFEPAYPAVVLVEPGQRAFETDENGMIFVDSLCPGRYILRFQSPGYTAQVDSLVVTGNQTYRLKVSHIDHLLDEVQVTEERERRLLQNQAQLDEQDLARSTGKTLGDLLGEVNGVSTLSNGATIVKPVIHGLHSNRIVLVNNGIRQEDQQWGGEQAPNIDPFLANRITVIKGAAGVRYGTDAIGGVVLVEPAPLPRVAGWNGVLDLAGFSNNRMGVASAMVEHNVARIPALSFRLQGTWKKGGNYRIPGHWVANTGVEETNFSAAVGYRKLHHGVELFYSHFDTHLGIYRGSHTGSENDLLNAINSSEPRVKAGFTYNIGRPRQHVTHDLLKAKLYADSRVGLWNLTYGFQHNHRKEFDVLRKENGRAQLNLTLNTQTINLNLDHKSLKGVSGQVGIDGVYQENFFQDGDRLFIPTYTSLGGAVYLIERYRHNNWTLEGGLRYDYRWYGVHNPEGSAQELVYYNFDYSNISGTLGFRQQLNNDCQWSATLANAWRAPQANELFSAGFHHGAARIELGNKNLRPEQSYSLNLETEFNVNSKLSVEISAYSQLINDYIFLEPGPYLLTIRGYLKTFNYRQTNAWLNGTDLTINYRWNEHLEASLKGSFLRARDRSAKDWLILIPSDRVSFDARYTRSISERLKDWFVSLTPGYVFEQTRIPQNFDAIDFPRPPKGYFLLDASIGGRVMAGKQPLDLSLSATNLLNSKYRDYLDVFRYFIDQPGTNLILRVRLPINFSQTKKQ